MHAAWYRRIRSNIDFVSRYKASLEVVRLSVMVGGMAKLTKEQKLDVEIAKSLHRSHNMAAGKYVLALFRGDHGEAARWSVIVATLGLFRAAWGVAAL